MKYCAQNCNEDEVFQVRLCNSPKTLIHDSSLNQHFCGASEIALYEIAGPLSQTWLFINASQGSSYLGRGSSTRNENKIKALPCSGSSILSAELQYPVR